MSVTRIIWLITNLIVLIIVSVWFIKTRDWEPLAALVAAFGSIVIFFLTKENNKNKDFTPKIKQHIKAGNNSFNIQSGRDTNLEK